MIQVSILVLSGFFFLHSDANVSLCCFIEASSSPSGYGGSQFKAPRLNFDDTDFPLELASLFTRSCKMTSGSSLRCFRSFLNFECFFTEAIL